MNIVDMFIIWLREERDCKLHMDQVKHQELRVHSVCLKARHKKKERGKKKERSGLSAHNKNMLVFYVICC